MPLLGMLTINALAAADAALIPVQAQYLSAKGLEQLLQTIQKVRRQINPKLKIEGILMTMTDSRTNYGREIDALIRQVYGSKMSDIAERKYGDPQVFLAAVGPARDLSAILLEEAPGILPCFDETDDTFGISKELPVVGCYNPKQVLELSGKRYLTGPVVFVRFNMEGEYVSLTMGDLHCIQEYLEQHSAALMADGKNLNCICLD